MTKLFVRPVDPSAPGSYLERKRFRRISAKLAAARKSNDEMELLALLEEAEDFVISRCQTDDGTPVETVLETISADDFDALLSAAGGSQSVPPENASNSSLPSGDTTPNSLNG